MKVAVLLTTALGIIIGIVGGVSNINTATSVIVTPWYKAEVSWGASMLTVIFIVELVYIAVKSITEAG